MAKKCVQWLYSELPKLVNEGVLSAKDVEQLRRHYGDAKGRGKGWLALIICSIFGALLIGLGIILLLGHNWEDLSRPIRTVLSLAPLIAAQLLAGWVIWQRSESTAWKEGTAIFISLMVGASIALIGQTYHIPGNLSNFLLSWMLLIIPLVYLMEVSIPGILYIVGITAWACSTYQNNILFWPMVALILPHFLQIIKKPEYTIRSTILSWVISISLCITVGVTLGKSWPGSWIIIYSALFAVLYLVGVFGIRQTKTNWQRPFHIIGGAGIFVLSFLLTFRDFWKFNRYGFERTLGTMQVVPDYFITSLLMAGAVLLLVTCVRRNRTGELLFGAIPILAIIGYSFSRSGTNVLVPIILFNLYLFTLAISRIVMGIRNTHLGLVNFGMLMLAALVAARFFDSNIGFAMKGTVFIIIGIGFLATNIVLIRRRGGVK